MTYNGIAKVQHYVPQFLLQNFACGKKKQIYVFDKETGRCFKSNIKNIAAESRFYDFQVAEKALSMEPLLSQIEGEASALFGRILGADSLSIISEQDRAQLSVFLSIQLTRTRWFRENWKTLPRMLGEKMRDMFKNEEQLKYIDEHFRVPDENQVKTEMAVWMSAAPKDFAGHFLDKDWILAKTERSRPFMISDNPLALYNMNDMTPYGNIGLAARGIQIFFPISATRALTLWCPSYKRMFEKGLDDLRIINSLAPHLDLGHLRKLEEIEEIVNAINNGSPFKYTHDNVTHFNSLQAYNAERYVFSAEEDFGLVQKMLKENPTIKVGPRFTID